MSEACGSLDEVREWFSFWSGKR